MNAYVKSWLASVLGPIAMICVVVFTDGWTRMISFVLLLAAVSTWPRCPRCKLPTYWTKGANTPDHFVMYRPRLAPGRECARCNQELDL